MKNSRTLICKFMILAMLITSSLIMSTSCKSGENGEVYVLCYGDYFDLDLVDKFEAETGIKVITEYYDTAEDMCTKFENDSTTYDCICTSDYMIQRMIENDMLDALDNNNIPEKKNIAEVYMKKSETFDPGNVYSVPYQLGVSGILYNKKMVGDEKIDSWDDLWNKKFEGQMVMPDSVRDAFMIGLKKNGYSLNSTSEDEIKKAAEDLIAQKPLVYKYANDNARDLLADGSAALGVVWNGEYIYTKDLNEDVEFVVPKEGTEFFIDSWVVPKGVANKENAEKWINFLCKAEVAAQNFDYLYYTTPNEAALELIDEEYLNEEAVFPSEETINQCETLKTLDSETTDLYSDYWKKVKAE